MYDFEGLSNAPAEQVSDRPFHLSSVPLDFGVYQRSFEYVVGQINIGNSFLTNLTFPTEIQLNHSLREVFYRSRARYKLWWRNRFVFFSPERFIRIKHHQISTYPMKGTIDAATPDAERRILQDTKEMAEHTTIVDLLRNDLSRHAERVHVRRFRYVEEIATSRSTLLQVSSDIVGTLPSDYHRQLGSLLHSLLPAGSVSGAPKPKTLDIIRQAELGPRGYYTGIAGYYDGEQLDSGVMIRFIEQQGNRLFYRSGGGITARSNAEAEYQELCDKVYVPLI